MEALKAVEIAAQTAKMPTTHLGPAMGRARTYFATMKTKGTTPHADTLAGLLAPCGYALAAVPFDDLPASALVIDSTPGDL